MSLFKPFRGNRSALDVLEKHDGYAYFCMDDGTFHIDYTDNNGELQRKQINAKDAETLLGATLVNELTSSDLEIPTGAAVTKELDDVRQLIDSHVDDLDARISDLSEDMINHVDTTKAELVESMAAMDAKVDEKIGVDYIILKDISNGFNYIVQMQDGSLVSCCRYASITIVTPPDKVDYFSDEEFDPTGMVVGAVAEDGSITLIADYTYDPTLPETTGAVDFVIKYAQLSKEFETTVTLNVTYTEGIRLLSADGLILKDSDELYLTAKENE